MSNILEWYTVHARPFLASRTIPKMLQKFDEHAEELRQLLGQKPSPEIAFLGSTTAGKSTTINALLRRRLLPENRIGSTTAARIKIRYGHRERLVVQYVPAEQLTEDLKRLSSEWSRIDAEARELAEPPDYQSIERLRSIARNALGFEPNYQLTLSDVQRSLPESVTGLLGRSIEYEDDIHTRIYDHLVGRFWSIVDSAVLEIPHELLETGLCIVDLPGTGDTDQGRLEALRRYVDRADEFVLVLGIALVTDDVQRLLFESDLLLKLVSRRRPLIVVGTKLDTAGTPTADDLASWKVNPSLSGLRATEAMWCVKAEHRFQELMKQLIGKVHPQREGEPNEDYDARVREHFDRSEFIPINPRAALEMDPSTRGEATDLAVQQWRERYPYNEHLGIDELGRALREVAAARRHQHKADTDFLESTFAKLLHSALEVAPTSSEDIDVASEREVCETHSRAALAAIDGLASKANNSIKTFADAVAACVDDLVKSKPEQTRLRVTRHLDPKHHSTVKACVRAPRNGIWNTVHLPKALFEKLQLQVIDEWSALRGRLFEVLDEQATSLQSYCVAIEAELGAMSAVGQQCRSSLEQGRRVLQTHTELVRRDLNDELNRIGVPLSDQIEKAARDALSDPCKIAEAYTGQGTKQRIMTLLSDNASRVTEATVARVRDLIGEAMKRVTETWNERVMQGGKRTLVAVAEDLDRAIENAGSAGSNHDDHDAGVKVLRLMPGVASDDSPQTPAVETATPETRIPFRILVGHSNAAQEVVWEPARPQSPLNNFGLLVTGDSGTGKTQFLRALIADSVKHGVSACVFDFKNDYADEAFSASAGLTVHDISRRGLPFNPLFLTPDRRGEIQPIRHVHEIADILGRVFHLGPVQLGHLRRAMSEAYERHGISTRDHIRVTPNLSVPSFSEVVHLLEEHETGSPNLITKLSPLFDLGLFPDASAATMRFEDLLARPLVLDFHELPNDRIKATLAEIVILRIHGHVVRSEQHRELRSLLIFDEAWRVARSARLQELAREGRAFGVGIVIGTQFPGDLPDNMTGNLATQLSLHNINHEHRKSVAQQLCGLSGARATQQVMEDFQSLKKHEGFFRNTHYVPYVQVATLPHYQRRTEGR
jgi:predicted GTPase